jgi:single-strand DNA-binding protein
MDTYLTMQGNLVADPVQKPGGAAGKVTKFRVAASGRHFDKGVGEWVDSDPVYMDVTCWKQLGDNVFTTLHKGDTVVVRGRLSYREWEDAEGKRRSSYEVVASSVAPDLSRYVALLSKPNRQLDDTVQPVDEAEVESAA